MRKVLIIANKEINSFFSSLIAYIVLSVFITGIGLFLWIFPNNIIELRTASLEILFYLAPWFYLFLVPAITMRSFSEEFRLGTFELIYTKPLTSSHLVIGKFLGANTLVLLSLIPTLIYYITIIVIGDPPNNIDHAATIGSYIGVIFIGAVFVSVGIFSSALTNNQIVAFLLSAFFSFILFAGFDFLAQVPTFKNISSYIMQLGIWEHYRSISRGVLDSRDILYFISVIFIMLFSTIFLIEQKVK